MRDRAFGWLATLPLAALLVLLLAPLLRLGWEGWGQGGES